MVCERRRRPVGAVRGAGTAPLRPAPRRSASAIVAGIVVGLLGGAAAQAQTTHGVFTYYSRQNCESAGKLSREICANAQANAEAEFEEKAPHYPARAACEQANGRGQCALSLRTSAGVQGAKGGVSFTIRQQGFKIVARSDHDVTTIPQARGLTFLARTALQRRTSIDPRAIARAAPHGAIGAAAGQTFGVSTPIGVAGPVPPPAPYDPNFRCSDYIEPSSKGDVDTACAPAPRYPR